MKISISSETSFCFGFIWKKVASATASLYIIYKRLVFSIPLSHFPSPFLHFSLRKNSHFFSHTFPDNPIHPIFKSRKFSLKKVVFLTTKTDVFNSRNGFKDFPQKIWSSLFKRVFNLEMLNEFIFSVSADYGDEKVI